MTFRVVFCCDGSPAAGERDVRAGSDHAGARVIRLGRADQAAFFLAEPTHANARAVSSQQGNWLLGRIRLDRRADLAAALTAPRENGAALADHALCLAAYERWGERFLDRLYGDFCFALWDDQQQTMLCARDQLGVRPLFTAQIGSRWIVSDSLDDIGSTEGFVHRLDPVWIADFLAGPAVDCPRTAFAAARRVPPGHAIRLGAGGATLHRYWTLEVAEPLQFADPRRYVEEFHARVSQAVAERLPSGRVGIQMSGGLDSPTLAAKAVELTGDPARVVAQTRYFHALIPDDEAHFSALAAAKLNIAHTLINQDAVCYDPVWYESSKTFAEPDTNIVFCRLEQPIAAEMRRQAEVWLYGEGPDNALTYEWRPYLRWLFARRHWLGLASESIDFVRLMRAAEWRKAVTRLCRGKTPWIPSPPVAVPDWIDADLAARTGLASRLVNHGDAHPWRPSAFRSFTSATWPIVLEPFDPTVTGTNLDWRHPYLDLRVMTFLLAVPPIRWSKRKTLIRAAMQGVLPEAVLQRDKTPLQQDPQAAAMLRHPLPPLPHNSPVGGFVDLRKVAAFGSDEPALIDLLKIHVLDHWLRQRKCS